MYADEGVKRCAAAAVVMADEKPTAKEPSAVSQASDAPIHIAVRQGQSRIDHLGSRTDVERNQQ